MDSPHTKRRRIQTVFTPTHVDDVGVYQPKTKETQAAYEAMLTLIQHHLGGQPFNLLTGAAHHILDVLNNDALNNAKKKVEIERLLNHISNNVFDQFVSIGRLITDYGAGSDDDGAAGDDFFNENVGVAVELQENEESDHDMVQDDDDDDDDQHQIDPQQTQKLAEEVLNILAEGGDDRQVETKLLVHLRYDKFSLVKYLLKNQVNIVWCIRLARAQHQEERKKIEEDMMQLGPNLAFTLEQLHPTRATAKERQTNLMKSIRQEAHRLKDESSGDRDHGRRGTLDRDADIMWLKGQRQLLDLESLAFSQGGLLMANRKCELPSGSYRIHNKDYEEVHVPALRSKPLAAGEELIRVSDMPNWARPAFEGMSQLNRVQSKVYDTALFSAQNLLLCAPTGAAITR